MVLRTRDIQPRITLETYVGYPSLKRVAIPIAANNDGEAVGLIQKIRRLDPLIAKDHIYIDPLVIDRAHSRENLDTGAVEKLLSQQSLNDLERFFKPVDDLISDPVFLYATEEGNQSRFLKNTSSGLKLWQDMTLQNGGWMVKPQFLLRDLKGFVDNEGFDADRSFMKDVNMCKYRNPKGLVFKKSSLEDFARVNGIEITNQNKNYYDRIHNVIKKLSSSSLPLSTNQGKQIKDLIYKSDSESKESKRIETLSNITGFSESYIKNNYTLTEEMDDKNRIAHNRVAQNLIQRVQRLYENKSESNREKACKLVTVLNDLQERKGWHNRITPMNAVDTPEKAHHTLVGSSEDFIKSDLKRAEKNLKNTANLLKICDDANDPTSCIHPTEKENLGLYGRNKNGEFEQKSWIEPDMRAYALVDVPLTFIQRDSSANGRVSLIRDYKKAIKESGISFKDPLDNVHNYKSLSRFGSVVGLPLTNPSESNISFAPDKNPSIRSTERGIQKSLERINKSKEIEKSIEGYYQGEDPVIVSNKRREFQPLTRSEIRNDPSLWNAFISEAMVYPHELLTHPIDSEGERKHIGCLRTQLKHDNGSIAITSGELVLLDGRNEMIKWRKSNGNRKKISEVSEEILNRTGDQQQADPSKWKWSCIADSNVDPSFLQNIPPNKQFRMKKFVSRRSIDLDYRKHGNSNLKLSVDKDSIANALKDISIDALNAITLGNMTQTPNYVSGGNSTLFTQQSNWNDIRRGGSIQKRQKVQELNSKIKETQEILNTEKQFNILKDITSNERNTSINANAMWFDPQSRVLIQRRKDISKKNYGLPKALFNNPIQSNAENRLRVQKKAILALETNLEDVFKSLGVTPTKK